MREQINLKNKISLSYKNLSDERLQNQRKITVSLKNLPDNIYFKLEKSYRRKFFQEIIKLFKGKLNLARKLGMKKSDEVTRYQNGKYSCPLSLIKKIFFMLGKDDHQFEEIKNHILEIKWGYRTAKPIKNPKFSFHLLDQLGCLVGHVLGDGGIRIAKHICAPHYTNTSPVLIQEFENCLSIFGDVEYNKFLIDNVGYINAPSIVGLFLIQMFGSFTKEEKIIPNIILNSNKTCKRKLLRALFDDEGCVNVSAYTIAINMTSKFVIRTIKKMLKEEGICVGKIGIEKYPSMKRGIKYRIAICGKGDLEKFYTKIGFSHLEKVKKLEALLRKYKHKYCYKKLEIRKLITNIIKKNKVIKTRELARAVKRVPHGRFHKHLHSLEKERKIIWNKGKGLIREGNY